MKRLLNPCFSKENGGFCVVMRMLFHRTHNSEYCHIKLIIFSFVWVILLSFYSSASASSAACDSCLASCHGDALCCTGTGCWCEEECSYGNCPADQHEKFYCPLYGNCWVIGCECDTIGTPSLVSPADGLKDMSISPMLDWGDTSGTRSYDVRVCSDSTCSSVVTSTNVLASQWQVAPALNSGITHWWQVRAKNSCTSGAWATAKKFTTVCTAPPATPELLSPADNLGGVSADPTLDWSDVVCASTYDVQVCSDSVCSSIVASTNVLDSQWQVAPALNSGTTYWWQVRALNAYGNSSWSMTRQFTTSLSYALRVAVGNSGAIFTSSDIISWASWVSRISETTNPLWGVAYGKNTFVAVGQTGTILTSPKGIVWTSRTSGISSNIWGVTYGNDTFVAVGDSGVILTSSDGISWTPQTSGTTNYLSGVTYGNNIFVAVGASGTIRTSPDGMTWTSRTSGTNALYSVAYGNNTFVAAGAAGTIRTSPDGTTWTPRTSVINALNSVAYGNNTFVAVGSSGTIYTSPDGMTWTSRTSRVSQADLYSVTYGNNSFGAVGVSGTILTSSDGIVWKSQTSGATMALCGITTIRLMGDLDDDGILRLQDAILALQFLSGFQPATVVSSLADVNGDGKIGLAEVIYIMQEIAGVRQY
jgi:hypothetical protein